MSFLIINHIYLSLFKFIINDNKRFKKFINFIFSSDVYSKKLYDYISESDNFIDHIKHFIQETDVGESNQFTRENWLKEKLGQIKEGSRILDAGAGELQYKKFCNHLVYISQDFAKYNGFGDGTALQAGNWDQSNLDIISDITSIPEPNSSFEVIICIEVLEHLADPILALREFFRLLKIGGTLLITAPFCSLTHFAPYHYYSGFNHYFFENHLLSIGFEIDEITPSGNYFEYIAQEIRRIPSISKRYAKDMPTNNELLSSKILLNMLNRFSSTDNGSHELLNYEYFIKAKKIK